ncbi:MAG: hypothetical protein IPK82_40545 [Polyangiaceae bacterium]|nr:hypothetical protein [Polyangiaceae bacterium]
MAKREKAMVDAQTHAAHAAVFEMAPSVVAEWHSAFGTLSLDLARGALPAMGVTGFDEDTLVSILREQLENFWDEGAETQARARRLVYTTFSDLDAALGEHFFDAFMDWGRTIWLAEQALQSQAFLWARLALVDSELLGDGAVVPPLVQKLRDEIVRRTDVPLFARTPETGWDRRYFQRLGYSTAASTDGGDADPMRRVQEHVRFFHLRQAWIEASKVASDPDAETAHVLLWAQSVAPRVNIPPHMVAQPGSWI